MRKSGAIGITADMYKEFPHGVLGYYYLNDKEGIRSDQPSEEWWRIYPITEDEAAEWDLNHKRTEEYYGKIEDGGLGGVYDWHPKAPLFRDTKDPQQPLST